MLKIMSIYNESSDQNHLKSDMISLIFLLE